MTHTICRLQREQPVCRFKAKTLISLRTNQTTQAAIFFNWQQECFDIKDNLYNQFFITTSTGFWTFCTFHPSLHEFVALDRVLDISWVLNIQDSEYDRVLNMQKLRSALNICHNLAEYVGIYDIRQGSEYLSCNT